MNRVMVQPNPTKEEALKVSCELIDLLLREEFEVLALEEFRAVLTQVLPNDNLRRVRFMAEPDIYPSCDFIF